MVRVEAGVLIWQMSRLWGESEEGGVRCNESVDMEAGFFPTRKGWKQSWWREILYVLHIKRRWNDE